MVGTKGSARALPRSPGDILGAAVRRVGCRDPARPIRTDGWAGGIWTRANQAKFPDREKNETVLTHRCGIREIRKIETGTIKLFKLNIFN